MFATFFNVLIIGALAYAAWLAHTIGRVWVPKRRRAGVVTAGMARTIGKIYALAAILFTIGLLPLGVSDEFYLLGIAAYLLGLALAYLAPGDENAMQSSSLPAPADEIEYPDDI